MPLFERELDDLADRIGRSDLTIWLHTSAPTNGSPTKGRTTVGGGAYESGATLAAGNITAASNGDIENNAAIDFGTADEDVGTVTHWSAFRGGVAVGFDTLPATVIASRDSFRIRANTLTFNGSTT